MECPTLNTINKSLKVDDIINANQHGFIENRSCETSLLSHSNEITGLLDKDNSRYDIIGFSKAFDLVAEDFVINSLHRYNKNMAC